jgi:hypothetical protein
LGSMSAGMIYEVVPNKKGSRPLSEMGRCLLFTAQSTRFCFTAGSRSSL